MLEFDMLSGEFLNEDTTAEPEAEQWRRMREPYPQLALLSVEEAEAERKRR